MSSSIVAAAAALREALSGFDAGVFSGGDCALLADELASTEKAFAWAHLMAAARIGDPPEFTGKKCVDCGKRHGLQWTTSIRSPTAAPPALTISNRAVGRTTRRRPNVTVAPGSSVPTAPDRPTPPEFSPRCEPAWA